MYYLEYFYVADVQSIIIVEVDCGAVVDMARISFAVIILTDKPLMFSCFPIIRTFWELLRFS